MTRSERGFTVVEMLVAMMILGIVATGAMTFIEVVMRQGRGVVDRTESAQRGRLALDQMTRLIRSQVCLDATTKGLVAATPNTLTFYADLTAGNATPVKRQLAYQPASRSIVERTYTANGTAVQRESELLENVDPAPDPGQAKATPTLFNYYAYPDSLPAGEPVWLGDAFNGSQVPRIAVVTVNVAVYPQGTRDDDARTVLNDQVVLRNADPNATNNDPTCQ